MFTNRPKFAKLLYGITVLSVRKLMYLMNRRCCPYTKYGRQCLKLQNIEGSILTMEKKIRIGICGYGNLGHGVELAVNRAADMELVGVFSRRDLPGTDSGAPAINLKHVL